MKAYNNLGDHYQQKLKSPLSDKNLLGTLNLHHNTLFLTILRSQVWKGLLLMLIHKIISFQAVVVFQFYSDCLWPCCVVSLTLVLESLLFGKAGGLLVRLTSLTMTPLSPSLLSLLDISMSVISSLISTTLKLKKRKRNL